MDYTANVQVHAPIDNSRSIEDLNHSASFHDPSKEVLGLAESDLDLSASGSYAYMPYIGKNCFWVNSIGAIMVYKSLKIYVASEYKKGSCEYRHVLKHEK